MTTGMDKIDLMFRDASALPGEKKGLVDEEPVSFEITGVQVNEQSKRITLYRTDTNEPVEINKINVPATLKKVYTDPQKPKLLGKPIFSKTQLGERKLGHFKCLLHEDQPDYQNKYSTMGFESCIAEHLPSHRQVIMHMEHKHQSEWKAIKADQDEAERQESLGLQRQLLERMSMASGAAVLTPEEAPLYVSDKPNRKVRK